MAKTINVMVACGSGVATSTIAKEKVEAIAKEAGISIRVVKCTLGEVPARQNEVDLILTTANYRKPLEKPQISVFGLVSGIGEDAVKANVLNKLQELAN